MRIHYSQDRVPFSAVSKHLRQLGLSLALLLAAALPVAAQVVAVTDFEDGTVQGWTGLGVRLPGPEVRTDGSLGGPGDHYLWFEDRASAPGETGLSILAPPPFLGDYTTLAQRCATLELDVRVFDDQFGELGFRVVFERDDDGYAEGADPELRAVFQLDAPIDESSGWVHVVVPLFLLDADGHLPSNASGSWRMTTGSDAEWNRLLSRVDHLVLPFEINGGTQEKAAIDNVRLVAGECPCAVGAPSYARRGGVPDDFALPLEPARPLPALVADYPGTVFNGFDDTVGDRFVAHTFPQLPSGIVRAELTVRMHPIHGGSDNDALYLLYEGDMHFAWGSHIDLLPASNGSWQNGDPARTFQLDLADLPGGGDLIAKLNTEHRLDFLVQDDTAVDYALLRLWTCPGPVVVDGFGFEPDPDTTAVPNVVGGLDFLAADPPDRFGFGVDLGSAEGFCVALDKVCIGKEGEASHLAMIGKTTEAMDIYTTGTLSLDSVGSGVQVSVDWEPDLPVIVRVAQTDPDDPADPQKDSLVGERINLPEGAVAEIPGTACIEEFDDFGQCFRVWLTDPVPVKVLPNGPTFVGDVVDVCHDIVDSNAPLGRIEVEAAGWDGPLRVGGAKVLQFGLLAQALGSARLEPFDGGLGMSGIGDSGDDGVVFDLTDAESARLHWAPLDAVYVPPIGAHVAVSAAGELGGVADRPLGSLRVTKTANGGSAYEIVADFDDLEATTQRVQVLSGGEIVADMPTAAGLVGHADGWPDGLGKLNLPNRTKCYVGTWPSGTRFSIDGATVHGDELRVLLEGIGDEVGPLSELSLRAAGIPQIALTGAESGIGDCMPGEHTLCLNDGRFRVEVEWKDFRGNTGDGTAEPLTTDTGYFWFFRDTNVELVIKVLAGRPVNGNWWVFYGALSNVEYTITVIDTVTEQRKRYFNPSGTFASRGDTEAFLATDALGASSAPAALAALEHPESYFAPFAIAPFAAAPPRRIAGAAGTCAGGDDALCLNAQRFRVDVEWKDFQGHTGVGTAVPLTSDTGYFWFFSDTNVELIVKVLDGRPVNGHWWVFYGALSNVEYTLHVTDTEKHRTMTYENPSGTFASRGDTEAFAGDG